MIWVNVPKAFIVKKLILRHYMEEVKKLILRHYMEEALSVIYSTQFQSPNKLTSWVSRNKTVDFVVFGGTST